MRCRHHSRADRVGGPPGGPRWYGCQLDEHGREVDHVVLVEGRAVTVASGRGRRLERAPETAAIPVRAPRDVLDRYDQAPEPRKAGARRAAADAFAAALTDGE